MNFVLMFQDPLFKENVELYVRESLKCRVSASSLLSGLVISERHTNCFQWVNRRSYYITAGLSPKL